MDLVQVFREDPWPVVALAGVCGEVLVRFTKVVAGGFFGLFDSPLTTVYAQSEEDDEDDEDEVEEDEDEAEDEPGPAVAGGMQPGYFVLNRDVQNPDANRAHTRDWTKFPVWKKGGRYALVHKASDGLDVVVCLDEPHIGLCWVRADKRAGELLIGNCTRTSPSSLDDIVRYSAARHRGVTAADFVEHLLDTGVLSVARLAQLEEEIHAKQQSEQAPES